MADTLMIHAGGIDPVRFQVDTLKGIKDTITLDVITKSSRTTIFLNEERLGQLFGTINNYLETLDKVTA